MNKERIKELRDFVAALPPQHFNMGFWLKIDRPLETAKEVVQHTCGTAGCLAGWATALFLPPETKFFWGASNHTAKCEAFENFDYERIARELLDLNPHEAASLFQGDWFNNWDCIGSDIAGEKAQALALEVLDRMLNDKPWRGAVECDHDHEGCPYPGDYNYE